MEKYKIFYKDNYKVCNSTDYNYIFNMNNGKFIRWGKNIFCDPSQSEFPEILDIEISSGGKCLGNCEFCYKDNGGDKVVYNMSFDTFKSIIDKFPQQNNIHFLTQVAFGIMNISTNPDFFKMMEYCRSKNIIPNYTCHGLDITDEYAKKTARLCGSIAISCLNVDKTIESVNKFSEHGMKQINLHYMLSEETYEKAFKVIDKIKNTNVNAIVFLQYKPKGKNKNQFHSILDSSKYTKLINYCNENNVKYGFDSCSSNLYCQSVKKCVKYNKYFKIFTEPCESGLFSSYINCEGDFYPCSFLENEDNWKEGLSLLEVNEFEDIWNHPKVDNWKKRLLNNKRKCPAYKIDI